MDIRYYLFLIFLIFTNSWLNPNRGRYCKTIVRIFLFSCLFLYNDFRMLVVAFSCNYVRKHVWINEAYIIKLINYYWEQRPKQTFSWTARSNGLIHYKNAIIFLSTYSYLEHSMVPRPRKKFFQTLKRFATH